MKTATAPAAYPDIRPVRILACRFDRADLRATLARLKPLTDSGAYPLVRLDVHATGETTLHATDLRTFATFRGPKVPAESLSPGSAVIPVALLKGLTRGGGKGQAPHPLLTVLPGGRVVVDDRGSYSEARGLPAACWPEGPGETHFGPGTAFPGHALYGALKAALLTVCGDPARPHLGCVQLKAQGTQSTVVSTDSHRLTLVSSARSDAHPDFEALLPGPTAAMVAALAFGTSSVRLSLDPAALRCSDASGRESVSAWIPFEGAPGDPREMVFPRWDAIVPHPSAAKTVARVNPVDLHRRAKVADSKGLALAFRAGAVDVCTDADPSGLTVAAEHTGAPVRIGVNARYLQEAMEAVQTARLAHGCTSKDLAAPVEIRCSSEFDPMVVFDSRTGLTVLVMPMRL